MERLDYYETVSMCLPREERGERVLSRRRILWIVIPMLLIYALLCLARAGRSLAEMEQTVAALQTEREILAREHAQLELRLVQLEDPARMEALARRELGLVMPGEMVFLFAEKAQTNSEETERNPLWPWK